MRLRWLRTPRQNLLKKVNVASIVDVQNDIPACLLGYGSPMPEILHVPKDRVQLGAAELLA
jgi:hypothetical protein